MGSWIKLAFHFVQPRQTNFFKLMRREVEIFRSMPADDDLNFKLLKNRAGKYCAGADGLTLQSKLRQHVAGFRCLAFYLFFTYSQII